VPARFALLRRVVVDVEASGEDEAAHGVEEVQRVVGLPFEDVGSALLGFDFISLRYMQRLTWINGSTLSNQLRSASSLPTLSVEAISHYTNRQ
jgi:hypothetical protein